MRKFTVLIIAILLVTLSGCYLFLVVEENEIALVQPDGVRVTEVLGPGRHGGAGGFASYTIIDSSVKTWTWIDDSLATKDKQTIGLSLAVSVRRNPESLEAIKMFRTYKAEATDDVALQNVVFNRVPRVAKAITSKFTLDELIGVAESDEESGQSTRQQIADEMFGLLQKELDEFGTILVDIGINDISLSEAYKLSLEKKAQAQIDTEIAKERTVQLQQELLKEQQQTLIEIEKASRENRVQEELAKVFETSPEALELERLRIIAESINSNDKMFFIPEGASLSIFLSPSRDSTQQIIAPLPVPADASQIENVATQEGE